MKKDNFKIVDCFTFYNELELLQLRLAELYDHVDYFILSESLHTHRGKSKNLYFQDNIKLFSKYKDKIIHVVDEKKYDKKDYSWKIENNQRNKINDGLSKIDLNDQDQIIISDLDEIPNMEKLLAHLPVNWIHTLEMDFYYYNLYNKIKMKWKKSKILNYKTYKNKFNKEPQLVRDSVDYKKIFNFRIDRNVIKNSGWHFSYFGDIDFIQNKIINFAHHEYDKEEYSSLENIENSINNSIDLYGTKEIKINKLSKIDYSKLPSNVEIIIN